MYIGAQGYSIWYECHDYPGWFFSPRHGEAYAWDGLPVHSDINEKINGPIAASMILCGVIGLLLNLFCGMLILRNRSTSKAVKCYLLLDCYCRLNEACTEFYKAFCVLSWVCVKTDNFPFSGILVNMIVMNVHTGLIYSMQLLGNGLCLNRIFAVFFNGLYYSNIERIAVPHSLSLWLLPCIVYVYQIGVVRENRSDFTCYTGFYFSPLEFCPMCTFMKDWLSDFLLRHFDKFMYAVLGVTMTLDVFTLWKIRRLEKSSKSKRNADVRLSVMLVTTHFITVCYLVCNYVLNNVLFGIFLPIHLYLLFDLMPFFVHTTLGLVIMYFNLPTWEKKATARIIKVPETVNRTQQTLVK